MTTSSMDYKTTLALYLSGRNMPAQPGNESSTPVVNAGGLAVSASGAIVSAQVLS